MAGALVALAAVGAPPERVVRSVIRVVSDGTPVLAGARSRLTASSLASVLPSADAPLGVAQPGFRGRLAELDLTAPR